MEEILEKLTIEAEVETLDEADGTRFVVRSGDSGMLIGENGKHLIAFSHIVKRIVDARVVDTERFSFSIDVNDYQAKRIDELKNLAKMNAQRVRYFKKEVEMSPMNSYERRIIHSALTGDPDITTESVGKGLDRRVVIKPYVI